jgi:hypothetical protein
MAAQVQYVNLTWEGVSQTGEIDCPTLDDPTDREVMERAARRAFWTLVSGGYGDVDDVKVYYDGEWIPMGPQREGGNDAA